MNPEMGRLFSYVGRHKGTLFGGLGGAVISVICTLLIPILVGRAIDHIVGPNQVDFDVVGRLLVMLAIAAGLGALFHWIMLLCTRSISAKVAQEIRRDAFAKINRAPLSKIDAHPQGDLLSRLVADAEAVNEGILQTLSVLFPGLVTVIATIAFMFTLHVGIGILVIVATPLSILLARFIGNRTSKYFRAQSKTQGQMGAFVSEMVENRAMIAALGWEKASQEDFRRLNDAYFRDNFKATFYSSLSNPGARFVNALIYVAVVLCGGILAIGGGLSIGALSAFLSYVSQYTRPLNEITAVLTQIQAAKAGAQRLFAVIDWASEPPDVPGAKMPETCTGTVDMEAVCFSYERERPLLQNIYLHAPPGAHIALVGPTGSGKTTLVSLLMRFYEVDSGTIAIDGVPIAEMERGSLRRLYGMVLQDSWLKQATVGENIAYGRPEASGKEIEAAAKSAYAHKVILGLPQGYDTVLGEGSGLSEGQKQLLCIARIFLAKPHMLILDEATSSIDTRTEMLLQKALGDLMAGRTSFIVAHRLSTVQNADCILVMDQGQVVERGTHRELLEKKGVYAKLYDSQFLP